MQGSNELRRIARRVGPPGVEHQELKRKLAVVSQALSDAARKLEAAARTARDPQQPPARAKELTGKLTDTP